MAQHLEQLVAPQVQCQWSDPRPVLLMQQEAEPWQLEKKRMPTPMHLRLCPRT